MKTFIKIIVTIVLIVAFINLFFIAKGYSYASNIEISIKGEDGTYKIVEPYNYNLSKIKNYFAFTNFYTNHKEVKESECIYKVLINEKDIICYDKGNYGTYKRRIDTISDIKEKVKEKDINAQSEDTYKTTNIALNKKFIKLLTSLGDN